MDFCKWTEELWKIYLSLDESNIGCVMEYVDEQCSVIGTGAHEFYSSLREFYKALGGELQERGRNRFQWKDFWCRQKLLSPESCLVYGKIHIFWESVDLKMNIDMDSRFSIVFCLLDGKWKVVHVHQSIPYKDQKDGEFYPKTMSEQMHEVQRKAEEMTRLAERDGLTGLFNLRALRDLWEGRVKENLWFFLLDLDDFKNVNDTCGHIVGNQVLKKTANILRESVRAHDIVCRMGGDEFILLCSDLYGEGKVRRLAERLLRNMESGRDRQPVTACWPTISIGITQIREGEELDAAMERADRALYHVKKTRKNDFHILM